MINKETKGLQNQIGQNNCFLNVIIQGKKKIK